MDLLDENRSLIHADTLWGAFVDGPDPVEFFALLFDNYCGTSACGIHCQFVLTKPPVVVLTEPWEENGVTTYEIYKPASCIKFD